ncbi:MAG: GatB/YqeY domain-containing protein [Gemmatimonadaceae bacterium]|nr:GatB/YqeY domain-containing protein [Gemmatimonadaceae bacterium]
MSTLLERVQSELTAARKAQDKALTLLIGTLLSEMKNRELELRRAVTDDDAIEVVRRAIKKRRESIEMYERGGRPELAAKEAAEVVMLERYLPAQVDPDEIRAAVRTAIASGAANVGAVMGKVMAAFKGRAEGGTISAIAREELAALG